MADSDASPRPARVLQWAQEHGEVGGVHASHRQLTQALRARGYAVDYVDTGAAARAARSVPSWWGRRTLHLFHITRLWRAVVLAPVFAVLPGRSALVLHSGSTLRQVQRLGRPGGTALRLALHAYDEIWAVNDEIRQVLPDSLQDRVRVVTPFVPTPGGADPRVQHRDPHAVAVATNAGLPHYHAELAVEVVRIVREADWPDATLRVLAYGHDGEHLARLRDAVAPDDWVTLTFDAPAEEVRAVLASSGVFLRPTDWDGDSVIVREALDAGARVVASDTAPRPLGVELAPLEAAALASAVTRGGRPSDGAGLAVDTLLVAAEEALSALETRG